MSVKIQLRRDSAANWTSVNPTLAAGEVGLEIDTQKSKIGDGSTAWNSLAYYSWLPSQAGQSGKYLKTDGLSLSWDTPSGGGGGGSPQFTAGHLANAQGYDNLAQILFYTAAYCGATGTVNTLAAFIGYNASGSNRTLDLAIYDSSFARLGTATAVVNAGTTGIKTVTLSGGVSVTAGSLYYLSGLITANDTDVRLAWGSNMGTSTLISGFLNGQTSSPSTISSPSATGRCYWFGAY